MFQADFTAYRFTYVISNQKQLLQICILFQCSS